MLGFPSSADRQRKHTLVIIVVVLSQPNHPNEHGDRTRTDWAKNKRKEKKE